MEMLGQELADLISIVWPHLAAGWVDEGSWWVSASGPKTDQIVCVNQHIFFKQSNCDTIPHWHEIEALRQAGVFIILMHRH